MNLQKTIFLSAVTLMASTSFAAGPWPQGVDDIANTQTAKAITLPVLENDSGNGLELSKTNPYSSKGGSVSINADQRTIRYRSKLGFTGEDKLWYVFKDNEGRFNFAKVTIQVSAINSSAPADGVDDNASVAKNGSISIPVLDNDKGASLSLVSTNRWSQKGGQVAISNNKISYKAPANYIGDDNLWYVFKDSQGRKDFAKVTVAVTGGPVIIGGGMPVKSPQGSLLTGQSFASANNNVSLSYGFGDWSAKQGVRGTLTPACIELHDSYWVKAKGFKNTANQSAERIFHTWHPVYAEHPTSRINGRPEVCVFGHDHGDDPSKSPIFAYAGGWPAFGSVKETFTDYEEAGESPNTHRHEDHFGHKVTRATYRASIGNPPNTKLAVYDAGFYCHFLSKLHQGSYSNDALSNQTHEYFLAARCDDNPVGLAQRINSGASASARLSNDNNIRTQFSFKSMVPFGQANDFREMCKNRRISSNQIKGLNGSTIMSSRTPGYTVDAIDGANGLNPREIGCFEQWNKQYRFGAPRHVSQMDLWTQPKAIASPENTSLKFQVYYAIKDAIRMYDMGNGNLNNDSIEYTVDHCRDINAYHNQFTGTPHRYCQAVDSQQWNAPDSPFKGALRAIHFKKFALYNNSSSRSETFCTNAKGRAASSAPSGNCPAGKVAQKINPFNGGNNWDDFTNPVTGVVGPVTGSLYVLGQPLKYLSQPTNESDYQLISGNAALPGQPGLRGLIKPTRNGRIGRGCPRDQIEYYLEGKNPQDGQGNFIAASVSDAEINSRAPHAYCPVGIGFEKIVDNRDVVPLNMQSRVASGKNRTVHAPN